MISVVSSAKMGCTGAQEGSLRKSWPLPKACSMTTGRLDSWVWTEEEPWWWGCTLQGWAASGSTGRAHCWALTAGSPEHAHRMVQGDVVLPVLALPGEDICKDIVAAVADQAGVYQVGVTGHIVCARVPAAGRSSGPSCCSYGFARFEALVTTPPHAWL